MKSLEAFLLLSIIIFYFEEGVSQVPDNQEGVSKSVPCRKGYAANKKILVVISFDGLRNDYINSTTTPYLADLRDKGARGIFWTLQYPNALNVHHSIATGLWPRNHGVFAHEWFEDKFPNSPRKYQKYQREQYENTIANNKVIPIWTLNDQNGGTSACMMWPGCEFDYGPEKSHPTYRHDFNTNDTYDSRLRQIITWMNESITFNPPNLVMIYFRQPDYFAHVYGPNSPKIIPKLKELDQFTKNFTDKLKQLTFTRKNNKLFASVNFVFVSDHRLTEIFYEDIFDIPAQGECSDVTFYGSDVWLQQAWNSRENVTQQNKKENGEWTCSCSANDCYTKGYYDVNKNKWSGNPYTGVRWNCWKRTYNKSRCLIGMIQKSLPQHYRLTKTFTEKNLNFPKTIANFSIFLADVNHTWSLNMDESQKLVFAAYGEKLYPKIDNWRREYNFSVNECTKFGVHGYFPQEIGYFNAIGPAFVKNIDSRNFTALDLYSLFAKVLGIPKIYHRNGVFWRVKHLLINSDEAFGAGPVNWIQHLKLIVICSIIHCAVFFIAAELYLARRRNRNRKRNRNRNRKRNI